MQHVDPPDLTLWPTIRHLFPLWRAQWRLAAIGLSCAARVHDAVAHDPDPRAADDRQRDRRRRRVAPRPVPRRDRRRRDAPLRRQLHAALRDGPDRRHRRGTAPLEALRRVPALPARLLRPPRDRRGDLTRHERHLPGAVLHRLGRRAGDPERPDADRRRDRPDRRQPEARPDRGARDAAHRNPHLLLRTPRVPDLARGATQEGTPDGGVGRGGRRNRDGAGVRPRERRARPLLGPRRGGAGRDDATGARSRRASSRD